MKRFSLLVMVIAGLLAAASPPQTFTGVITDTMCGAKHGMIKGQSDDECARMCVKGSRDYALYDGNRIWKLSDQKTPAKFAARKVKVTGVANERDNVIKVALIEAAP